MTWVVLSLLKALCESLKDVFSKKGLADIDEYVIAWSLRFFALPFLLPMLLFVKIPALGDQFWPALLLGGGVNVVTSVLYMKAIKESALSLAVPMVAFTPLFLLLTSPFMVGELPDLPGIIGILLIVLGSYILNFSAASRGYLAPFRALLQARGPRLMLITALLWSITANFDKIGVQNSSPIFWSVATTAFVALALFPLMLCKSPSAVQHISLRSRALAPIGFFGAMTLIFQMTAISMALVAYVIAIKRTSAVMSVIGGHLVFKEKGVKERLLGASVMILGVVLISLF
ncbi:MAG: DMT family transporter [candidate division KSB1 bacterium]|nr:DMT family transporter [candidate division KSB1 bacterium]MDZ7365897.1 DMT family transporter [candidate division KSB1 bacterium]MDZ7403869.1 DMT family transporter [candidate division KSB1 bacterium]